MKKLSIFLILVLSLFLLCACGDSDETDTTDSTDKGSSTVCITFDSKGGTPVDPQNITKGGSLNTLPTPQKTGYQFEGWYAGESLWNGKSISADTTVSAKWTVLEFEIQYIITNGTNSEDNISTYTVEDSFVLKAPTVTEENNDFLGWYLVTDSGRTPIEKIEKGTTGKLVIEADIKYTPLEFTLLDNGTYQVSGLRDTSAARIEIPERYNGKAVAAIAPDAFKDCQFTNFTIPGSIKTIGQGAFQGCTALKKLTVKEGVLTIDPSAFRGCSALVTATLPSTVEAIGANAFSGCVKLELLNLSGAVTIGEAAFNYCSALTSVTFGDKLEYIGKGAFCRTGILAVNLPNSLKTIEESAFEKCEKLRVIKLGSGVEYIGSYAFKETAVESIIMPLSLTRTGSSLFEYTSIKKIYLVASEIPAGWAGNWCGTSGYELITGYQPK